LTSSLTPEALSVTFLSVRNCDFSGIRAQMGPKFFGRTDSPLFNLYLARVERFKLLRGQPDYLLWMEITRPKEHYFDYYNDKEPATLLRTDRTRGIRNLVGMLRALGDAYRPECQTTNRKSCITLAPLSLT